MGAVLASAGTDAAAGPLDPDEDPPPTWRFRQQDKPVKVVVIAGSVGAWQKGPYSKHFGSMCRNVEVRNLSMTGYGAWALKRRFIQQVLENPRVNLRNDDYEYWVVFQGGLNSIAMPEKTNRYLRELTMLAHKKGMKVVGLSPTPWGSEKDKRWKGARGLTYFRNTKTVVDYVTGKSSPRKALGTHESRRENPGAPWDASELPDVGVDLYNSPLRDQTAEQRDLEKMRKSVAKDSDWKKRNSDRSDVDKASQLELDALAATHLPQWYLRADLRSFDHIHPNQDGHRIIAETACPQLPESWDCSCPSGD
jgi:hypothetical protein